MPTENSNFTTTNGEEYKYKAALGSGQQADVWQVQRTHDSHKMALKLFKKLPAQAELYQQQERLETIIDVAKEIARTLPQAQVCFPRAIYSSANEFGVLMELAIGKPLNHDSLLTDPYDQPNPFISAALRSVLSNYDKYHHFLLAGFYLSQALRMIHSHGMTHCDLSLGNVFFNTSDGSICLIDCDNLACGNSNYLPVKVAGTPGFRAPELITAQHPHPSAETDRHSLAVLLFYLVMFRHPFIGDVDPNFNLDYMTEDEGLGTSAIFTEHPTDSRNRFTTNGIPFAHLPKSMQTRFQQVFTIGLKNPTKRHSAATWAREFWQALECMAECSNCHQRFFISDQNCTCLFCDTKHPNKRWYLKFSNGTKILATHGRKLYEHHLDNQEFQFKRPMAEIKETPERGMTLKNLSNDTWIVHLASGRQLRCKRNHAFRFVGVRAFDFAHGRVSIEPMTNSI